ncbi:MAG: NAD(P)/FAD-dependent oxidoreductase [Vicinamibacteria bacterium]
MADPWDVLVVGGGPAGLSAALVLGRCLRRVLVCDAGPKRNQASGALHGFLSRDGLAPRELLRVARAELGAYPTVVQRKARVRSIRRRGDLFDATLVGGARVRARRVLLATGVADDLPDWPGLRRFYGRGVFHCPYCDAYEVRGRRLAVWGETPAAAGLAVKLRSWSTDVVLLTGGAYPLSARRRTMLSDQGVRVLESPVVKLGGRGRAFERVHLADGTALPCDALFLTVPCRQACDLAGRLGCRFVKGSAVAVRRDGGTEVSGLFVAGDASIDSQMVVVAASEGARAAIAINEQLLAEDAARRRAEKRATS